MQIQDDALLLSSLEKAVTCQGGKITRIDQDEQLVEVETSDGAHVSINLGRMKQLIESGQETLDSALVRFLGTWDRLGEALKDERAQRSGLRISVEPAQILEDGQLIHFGVSDQLIAVLEWMDPEETGLVMLTDDLLAGWSISEQEAWQVAAANMDKLLAETPLELMHLHDGCVLGMLSTGSPLKASLILAPGLKEHVIAEISWPIMAVVPARDFLYIIPTDGRGGERLASVLGETVVQEKNNAAYPLSTEVFMINDEGIEAIAEYGSQPPVAS